MVIHARVSGDDAVVVSGSIGSRTEVPPSSAGASDLVGRAGGGVEGLIALELNTVPGFESDGVPRGDGREFVLVWVGGAFMGRCFFWG